MKHIPLRRQLALLLLLLICSIAASAQLTPSCSIVSTNANGTHNWFCPDTGDEVKNGINLSAITFTGPYYSCGDTIILQAGTRYDTVYNNGSQNLVRAFRMWNQNACAPGQITRIVSSNLANIPHNLRDLWPVANPAQKRKYISQMAQLVGQPNNGIYSDSETLLMMQSANNYYFGGIAIATPLGKDTGLMGYAGVNTNVNINSATYPGIFANDITFDRCFIGTQEEYVYGSVEDWYDPAMNAQADVNTWETWFRGGNLGVQAEGDRWTIKDSVIVTTGFDPYTGNNPEFSCDSGTNTNPAVLHCPGVAAAMALTPVSGCNYTSLTQACQVPDGNNNSAEKLAVMRGATGGWAGLSKLNGLKNLVYVDADDVAVYEAWYVPGRSPGISVDATTWGPFSGSVQGKATFNTQRNIQMDIWSGTGNWDQIFENNWLADEGGSSNVFFGGATVQMPPANGGNLQPGSVCANAVTAANTCVLNLDRANNLSVGDWVWLSSNNGVYVGGTLVNITVTTRSDGSQLATANFTSPPPNIRVGQAWRVAGASVNSLNNNGAGSAYQISSVGPSSFSFPVLLGVPNGTYNNPGLKMNALSACCPYSYPPQNACAFGVDRTGIVTGVSGNQVTLTGSQAGFGCVDPGAPIDIGSGARWNGRTNSYIKVSANAMHKPIQGYGKAYLENKQCNSCSVIGNTMCCQPYNNAFTELHEQGAAPWLNASNMEFGYNLFGDSFHGSSYGFQQFGQDPENSNMPSYGMRLVHNISVDIPWCNGCSTNKVFVALSGAPGADFSHNTFLSASSNPVAYQLYSGTDVCTSDGVGPLLGSYLQSPGATVSANVMGYGLGLGLPHGICDPIPAGINNNLFLNDLASPPDSWVAAQGNKMAASKAAIGFVGTCTTDNYLNCALASSSPYKGSAPDGSDPGADVYAVQDRINKWSQQAGLLIWDRPAARMIDNPGAFNYAASHMAMQFHRFGPLSGCSVRLFTNRARTVLHGDTATTGNQACARIGNIDENGMVTFVFGTVAPLASGTTYAYQVVDGPRIMVGEFTTAECEPAGPVTIQISDLTATDALIESSATADFSNSLESAPVSFCGGLATISTSLSGVRYYRWMKRANGKVIAYGPAAVAFRE